MNHRTPAAAVRALVEQFQTALSTAARSNVLFASGTSTGGVQSLGTPLGGRIQFRASSPLALELQFRFEIVQEGRHQFRTSTREYAYAVLDGDGREVMALHWHPHVARMPRPHLHLGTGIGAVHPAFSRMHVPTGRVAIEDVLQFAIGDLGVAPQRPDWQPVLAAGRQAFIDGRTWA